MSMKPRIHPYISQDCFVRLKALCKCPGRSESEIVDKALAAYFSYEHEDKRDGAIIRRLDRMSRQMEGEKRDHLVNAEAFGLFVRYFLTVIPPVPDKDRRAAQAQGAIRYETFLESLQTILEDGDPILYAVMDDVRVDESAFFTKDELMKLHVPGPKKLKPSETSHA